MWIQSLDWKDPLEEEMATHPSILAWKIPWTEEPGRLQSVGLKESDMNEYTHIHCPYFIHCSSFGAIHKNKTFCQSTLRSSLPNP